MQKGKEQRLDHLGEKAHLRKRVKETVGKRIDGQSDGVLKVEERRSERERWKQKRVT